MKRIYVLIGPKGGGKSYVGRLLEQELGIQFLSIEEIFIRLQKKGISTSEVQEKGYQRVEAHVTDILTQSNAVSFEITVLTPASKHLLSRLGLLAEIEMVQILAPLELCLERIKQRDASRHIDIPEERIMEINELSLKQPIHTNLKIDTSQLNDEEMLEKFRTAYSN